MRGRQRARRRRRDDELEEERAPLQEAEPVQRAAAGAAAPPTLADKTLELQKTAGNRAVGAALDRRPVAPASTAQGEATFDEELKIPVESVQDPNSHHPGTGRNREDQPTDGELVILTPTGEHSVQLQQALLQGKTYAEVVIVAGGVRIVLTNVMISNVQGSGEHQAWTLHYSKRRFAR